MEFASGEAESSVLVLFGSETGTAESLAYKLRKTVAQRGLPCRVCGMDDYDICQLPHERYVVMIVATAGDGETPTTMRNFWRFLLNKSLSASSLQGMNVGVFGLGDSSYAKFNACARRMTTRLQQLGARHCVPLGLGDDQAGYGYYTAWNDWIEAYLSAITVLFPPESVLSLSERQSVTTAREYRWHFIFTFIFMHASQNPHFFQASSNTIFSRTTAWCLRPTPPAMVRADLWAPRTPARSTGSDALPQRCSWRRVKRQSTALPT